MKSPRQCQIEGADGKSAVGEREATLEEQSRLQAERDQGCAEDQRTVNVAAQLRSLPLREQHGNRDIQQEEQDEKGFGARKQLRPVAQHAPHRTDHECEHEPHDVQRPPGLEPCDQEEPEIEHRIVAEQNDVAPLPCRGENRCQEAARSSEQRKGL